MKRRLKIKRDSLARVVLLAFLGYLVCITLFPHTHTIRGFKFTHSHPYAGTPENPGHVHTENEILTIAYASMLLAVLAAAVTVPDIFSRIVEARYVELHSQYCYRLATALSLRAPPTA